MARHDSISFWKYNEFLIAFLCYKDGQNRSSNARAQQNRRRWRTAKTEEWIWKITFYDAVPLHLALNMDRSTNKLNAIPRQIDTTINIQSCRSGVVRIVSTNVMFLKRSHDSLSPKLMSVSLFLLLLFTWCTVTTGPVHSARSALYVRNNKCSRWFMSSDCDNAAQLDGWTIELLHKFTRKINKAKQPKFTKHS